MSSCEGCLASRQAEMDEYAQAVKKAKERAKNEQIPIFILKTANGYTITDIIQPNAIEVITAD